MIYELNGLNKIRIWDKPCNELRLEKNQKRNLYEFDYKEEIAKKNRTIIAELFLPRGARVVYGILGADYEYEERKKISLITYETTDDKKIFQDSMLCRIENAYIGLTDEYAEGVYTGAKLAYDENKILLNGKLDFCYSAHAEASSSAWVFQKLAYLLCNLFCAPKEDINRQYLMELLN